MSWQQAERQGTHLSTDHRSITMPNYYCYYLTVTNWRPELEFSGLYFSPWSSCWFGLHILDLLDVGEGFVFQPNVKSLRGQLSRVNTTWWVMCHAGIRWINTGKSQDSWAAVYTVYEHKHWSDSCDSFFSLIFIYLFFIQTILRHDFRTESTL